MPSRDVSHHGIARRSSSTHSPPRLDARTRYDLRDFNDTVVKGCNVPLDVLAKNVDAYIRTAGARAAA